MKNLILSATLLMGLAFSAQAQEISKNAIGLRIGDNDGFGAEVSYQRKLGTANRLELDLGLRNRRDYYGDNRDDSSVKLVGLYQWVWNIEGGFNWYAGVGGGVGSWSNEGPKDYDGDDSGVFLLAAGDIGIEYVFDFPLQLSLDFRPEIYFVDDRNDYNDNYNSFGPDVALGVRYTF